MAAFVANSNILDLTGLLNAKASSYINDATVTVTIKDLDGNELTGISWPVTMAYVAASDGDYRATISEDLALVHKVNAVAHIEVDGGAGLVGHWEFKFKPTTRTGN